jgi:hypothetical protein
MANDVELKISANSSELTAAMRKAASDVRENVEQMHGHFEKLTGVFEKLNGAMVAFGAVLAGGEAFKEAIAETVKMTNEAFALSVRLGITAEAAGELGTALKLIGASSDTYASAALHLDKQIRKNEESVNAMGLKTRDANGELKNQAQLVQDAVAVLGQYKEGTDRNLASMQLFGKSIEEVMTISMLNTEMTERAKKAEEDLSLTITDKSIEASRHYQVAMAETGLVMEGVSKAIGDSMMPGLTRMAEWFRSVGPTVIAITKAALETFQTIMESVKSVAMQLWEVLKTVFSSVGGLINAVFGAGGEGITAMEFFVNTLRVVQVAAIGLRVGFELVVEVIQSVLAALVAYLVRFANVAERAFHLDFAGAKAAWKQGTGEIENIVEQSNANLVRIAMKGREDMDNAILGTGAKKEPDDSKYDLKMGKGSKSYVDPGKKEPKEKKDDSMMPFWEMKLSQAKAYYMQANDLREYSKQQEKQYWQGILESGAASSKERISIENKIAMIDLEIWKKSAKDKQEIDRMAVGNHEKSALDEVANDELTARSKLDNQQITIEQMLKLEAGYEERRYEIARKALDEKMALAQLDPDKNVVLMAQLHAQQEELARQHALKMHEIENKQTLDANKNWLNMTRTMESGFANVISGVLKGTLTMAQAIRGLMQTVVGAVIDMLAQMAAKYLANKLMEILVGKASAESQISAAAAVAGANGTASFAAAPWPVDIGAPVFGAAMAAAAGGFSVASAEGGFDIPAGINPVTQLHQKEMVLPAEHAETIRGMAGGGGGGTTVNYNVTAVDANSVKKFFDKHGPAMADALRGQGRNFQGAR